MDTVKIGRFLKGLRKEKSLTQREVAEKLNVSEKTISKWETGKGFPEISLILPLCKFFDINTNELLSGERLNENQYIEKAEENIVSLVSDRTTPRKKIIIFYNFVYFYNFIKPCFNFIIGILRNRNLASHRYDRYCLDSNYFRYCSYTSCCGEYGDL